MYPQGFATTVRVSGVITESWEGAVRGRRHFDGVATVVAKLLLAALPDAAYFGAKDAQQVAVVKRMVADLGIPAGIVVVPTSRDTDGLARSSRNARLSAEERATALAVPRALEAVTAAARRGETDAAALARAGRHALAVPGLEIEYLSLVDPVSLEPIDALRHEALVVVAVRVGATRLIDNAVIAPDRPERPAP